MANHKQARKRNRQNRKCQAQNRHYRSTMRTFVKRVRAAIAGKDSAGANSALQSATRMIDRCASKGIIPARRASRYVSRLTRAVRTLG